jgi:hypothetical protein
VAVGEVTGLISASVGGGGAALANAGCLGLVEPELPLEAAARAKNGERPPTGGDVGVCSQPE